MATTKKYLNFELTELNFSDDEKESSPDIFFSGLAYSGGKANGAVVDLEGIKFNKKVNLLSFHDTKKFAIGAAEIEILDNKVMIKKGQVYNDPALPQASEIAALMKKKHPLQLSIGVTGRLEFFEKEKEIFINGQNIVTSQVLRNAQLNEISFVTTPADKTTFVETLNFEKKEVKMEEQNNELAKIKLEFEALKKEKEEAVTLANSLLEEQKLATTKEKFKQFGLSDGFISLLAKMPAEEQAIVLQDQQEKFTKEKSSKQFKQDVLNSKMDEVNLEKNDDVINFGIAKFSKKDGLIL